MNWALLERVPAYNRHSCRKLPQTNAPSLQAQLLNHHLARIRWSTEPALASFCCFYDMQGPMPELCRSFGG